MKNATIVDCLTHVADMVAVVERVCCQPHTLAGATLSVTALESQPDVKVCAVQVSGILSTHTRDFISLYFENKKRSGGGPIDELVVDHDNGTAVVTFTSSDSKHFVMYCLLATPLLAATQLIV